jgi:hypothetical protein
MAQGSPRFCPRCGAATVPTQRLCPRCGLDLAPWLAQQPSQPSSQPGYQASQPGFPQSSQPDFDTRWGQTPPTQQAFIQSAPAGYGGYSAPPSTPVQATRRGGRQRLIIVLLLVILLLGGASYLVLHYMEVVNSTQTAITATSINSTVTYAGVTMTILKIEQSQRFINDPNSANDGMVRVHIQAHNTTVVPVNLMYDNIAALVIPGGKVLTPTYVKGNIGVAPGKTQTSIVDFAVPIATKVNQLVLRLGAQDEAQLNIPLIQGANLAQYAPKTTNLTGNFQYLGLNWSLINATTQYSIDGKQASQGMHYVIVMLDVSNPLSQTAIPGSPYDYLRLKAGNTTATPVDTTLPVSFASGANGKMGTTTFLVPQNATKLTLMLLAQSQSGFDQVTQDFQLA